jgi:DNA-binding LacI/PurR family transcriptional regulator
MESAIGMLLAAIDGVPVDPRRVVIRPELRDRGSAAPPTPTPTPRP